MKTREILIYLAIKFCGNWDKIYEFVSNHKELDEKDVVMTNENIKSKCVTLLDDDYPEQLKGCFKPPFVLFYHGDISLIKDVNKNISVVGTRHPSEYGIRVTKQLVKDICKNFNIVSGLALGVDVISHRTAIENGGKTIAVLGCGINVCYLPTNLDVYEECCKNHLVISEYPDLTPPVPLNFPIRNRIIGALSKGLLVTEGKINSGTQITAMAVLDNCGTVCCVPTRIGENSVCNSLINYGAILVESAQDVYEALKFCAPGQPFDN